MTENKGGRAVGSGRNGTKAVQIWLTEDEHRNIKAAAESLALDTVSFIRMAAMEKKNSVLALVCNVKGSDVVEPPVANDPMPTASRLDLIKAAAAKRGGVL